MDLHWICVCSYVDTFIDKQMDVYRHAYMHIFMRTYVCTFAHLHTCTYTYTHKYVHTHPALHIPLTIFLCNISVHIFHINPHACLSTYPHTASSKAFRPHTDIFRPHSAHASTPKPAHRREQSKWAYFILKSSVVGGSVTEKPREKGF